MKKLKLTIDELQVASFDTETDDAGRGTIAAQGLSGLTCPRCPTVPTRDGTCCTP
ncbi:MAG TPA: pinensin family lanthipeptide [Longimicrobium sp.]|nr:pinensin family lanthipeptide [Longimicrobium sp.]